MIIKQIRLEQTDLQIIFLTVLVFPVGQLKQRGKGSKTFTCSVENYGVIYGVGTTANANRKTETFIIVFVNFS